MSTQRAVMALVLLGALRAGTALAAGTSDEVAALRQELDQTKALVQQLESRLAAVEAQAAAARGAGGAGGGRRRNLRTCQLANRLQSRDQRRSAGLLQRLLRAIPMTAVISGFVPGRRGGAAQ